MAPAQAPPLSLDPLSTGDYFELSLDLLCTASFDGYFEQLNPAWERTLGYTQAELRARPFVEFVHPEDRERTEAEAAKLAEVGTDTIRFRNRYRRADGTYRWLEWNARAAKGRIYAAARDITVQKRAEELLENESAILERRVQERTVALEEARLETLQRLALAAEYRDDSTYEHTQRVGRTASLIARQLGLPAETVALLRHAAPLHDIGKLGIPDRILQKSGKLTAAEFRQMQAHLTIGAEILAGAKFPILKMAQKIALAHHEHWDGSGYVSGLRGEAIPLSGRIVAVADVFDALTHERPYKQAWPIDDAVAEIGRLAGGHFDPRVARGFLALDHRRLLKPIGEHDLDLPPPLLTSPTDGSGVASSLAVDASENLAPPRPAGDRQDHQTKGLAIAGTTPSGAPGSRG